MRHQLRQLATATERYLQRATKETRAQVAEALDKAYRVLKVQPPGRDVAGPKQDKLPRGKKGPSANDLTGKTYGALRALEPHRRLKAGWTWIVYCLSCGKLQDRNGSQLSRGYRDHCVFCRAHKRAKAPLPAPSLAEIEAFRRNFQYGERYQ